TTLSTALPHIRAGRIRALGLVEAKRQQSAPEIPTIGESIPGYAMPASWLGFFAPAGLPEAILKRYNGEIVKAVQSPDVRAKLEAAGMPIVGTASSPGKASCPLGGIGVVELGHSVAAPAAGQILGDLGAEVVKVEKPKGD